MDRKKKLRDNYIPENDELEEESGNMIDIEEEGVRNGRPGRVDFPEVEEEYTTSSFKADIAQQAGRFSDQVLMDSPAAEARTLGREGLKDIVEASERKLSEKLNKKE